MSAINHNNYEDYVKRFLAAETTLAEEQELYKFFRQPDLPPMAEQLRPMFGWYAELPDTATRSNNTRRLIRLKIWHRWSIAASLALLLGIGAFLQFNPLRSASDINPEYLAYEGSYIMRDGKKITDLSVVVPEIKRAEAQLQQRLNSIQTAINSADTRMNGAVVQELNMSNPTVRKAVLSSINATSQSL